MPTATDLVVAMRDYIDTKPLNREQRAVAGDLMAFAETFADDTHAGAASDGTIAASVTADHDDAS